jgi:hypothetical protein
MIDRGPDKSGEDAQSTTASRPHLKNAGSGAPIHHISWQSRVARPTSRMAMINQEMTLNGALRSLPVLHRTLDAAAMILASKASF